MTRRTAGVAICWTLWGLALPVWAGAASAADLPPQSIQTPSVAADEVTARWTGVRVGGHLGAVGLWSDVRVTATPSPPLFGLFGPLSGRQLDALGSKQPGRAGFSGGVHAGYDHRFGNIVLGAEGDLSFVSAEEQLASEKSVRTIYSGGMPLPIKTPATFRYAAELNHDIPWIATLRGRIGVLATEQVLFYLTAGVAAGEVRTSFNATLNPAAALLPDDVYARYRGSDRSVHLGGTIGAGVEYALAQNLSLRAEYLYINLGSGSYEAQPDSRAVFQFPVPAAPRGRAAAINPGGPFNPAPLLPGASVRVRDSGEFHTARIGLSYRFATH